MDWNPNWLASKLQLSLEKNTFIVTHGQERLNELIRKNDTLDFSMPNHVIDFLKELQLTNVHGQCHRSIVRYIEGNYQGDKVTFLNRVLDGGGYNGCLDLGWDIQLKQEKKVSIAAYFQLMNEEFQTHYAFFDHICPFIGFSSFPSNKTCEHSFHRRMSRSERKRFLLEQAWEKEQLVIETLRTYGTKKQKRKRYKIIKDL